MKEYDKLINAVLALGLEMKAMRKDMNQQLGEMKAMHKDITEMRKEQHKTNQLLAEHSRSIITLADKFDGLSTDVNGLRTDFNRYAESNNALVRSHETRIVRLEEKTPGSAYMAREPAVEYKKTHLSIL
ncbi:MAG: hypothetical protein ACYDCN_16440 [Bacteroidia bacterium]